MFPQGLNAPSLKGTIETILQSINIMYSKLGAIQLAKADVVIKPKVGHIGSADFSKKHEAILEGEKAAIEALATDYGYHYSTPTGRKVGVRYK